MSRLVAGEEDLNAPQALPLVDVQSLALFEMSIFHGMSGGLIFSSTRPVA